MSRHLAGVLAEFVGTFALMFVGGGAVLMAVSGGDPLAGLLVVALAHGFILCAMVSATLHVSGAQFNPAVSIALLVIGRQGSGRTLLFVLTQLLAASLAAGTLNLLLPHLVVPGGEQTALAATSVAATTGALTEAGDPVPVLALEAIATSLLMFVIMGTAVDRRGVGHPSSIGGFGIGIVVAANILCFGGATGASMNPARSFGPALVSGNWTMHWVYWAAPIVGAVAAALLWTATIGAAGTTTPEPSDR